MRKECDHNSNLYEQRQLLFIETEPQSNKYRQVLLSPEEFKKVSESFGHLVRTEGSMEVRSISMSDEIHELPDLQSICEEE